MPHLIDRSVIVIGTSAGGVETLTRLVRELDPQIPASIFVVQHIPATSRTVLPQILDRSGRLPVSEARHGEEFAPGRIYIAPNDRHLLVHRGHIALSRGPKENRCRPAVDPLFRSAARSYGAGVIGVVLTGNLDDGTSGLQVVKAAGGTTVVQDPLDAPFPGMPRSALENVQVDHLVALAELPELLLRLSREPVEGVEEVNHVTHGYALGMTDDYALRMESAMETSLPNHPPGDGENRSPFTCPDCRGSMIEVQNGESIMFRCHVGHAYSPESLSDGQAETLEQAMWTALAALEENIELSRRLGARARERNHKNTAELYEKRATENSERAALLRRALYRGTGVEPPAK